MSVAPLCQLAVSTTAEADDAVAELLGRVTGGQPSIHFDARSGRTRVSVFLSSGPTELLRQQAELRAGLRQLKQCGLDTGAARVSRRLIRHENWAESWKRHFKPLRIGRALLVKPSWSRQLPDKGQAVVILDPGLSFGTGQHSTTLFCLQELARLRDAQQRQSVLDIGTGSGILALAAARLGYAPVDAFDFDPESVRVATENARRNRLAARLHISRQDLTRLPLSTKNKFDVVCANLISTLLMQERRRIISRLKPGGVLVLAGILRSEFDLVRRHFTHGGLQYLRSRTQREWTSGSFLLRPGKI